MEKKISKLDVRLFYALSAAFLALAFLIAGSVKISAQYQGGDDANVQQAYIYDNASVLDRG